jgi:hydroxyacylglutathione hydrolase
MQAIRTISCGNKCIRTCGRRWLRPTRCFSGGAQGKQGGDVVLDTPGFSIFRKAVGPFAMNQYVLGCKSTNTAAFIDSGEAPEVTFADYALKSSFEVSHLLQTHGHIDHVVGLSASKKRYPDAPIYLNKKELAVYDNVHVMAKMYGLECDLPLPLVDIFVEEGQALSVGKIALEVILTPGHTPGHCIYFHDSPDTPFAFVGDLIFAGSVGRTDFPLSDQELMIESIRKIVELLPPETMLFPGHMGTTTMKKEIASNPYVKMWIK